MKCIKCAHPMIPDRQYRKKKPAGVRPHMAHGLCKNCYQKATTSRRQSVTRRPEGCGDCGRAFRGPNDHGGRGLCRSCYTARHKAGTLIDVPRINLSRADLLDDWQTIYDPGRSFTENLAEAAGRMGRNPQSLRRSLANAGIAA